MIVLGVVVAVAILSGSVLRFVRSHATFSDHKLRRMRGFYAAQAGMNYAFEMLRTGDWDFNNIYCINGPVDPVICDPASFNDPEIEYPVQIRIWPVGGGTTPIVGSAQMEVKVRYEP